VLLLSSAAAFSHAAASLDVSCSSLWLSARKITLFLVLISLVMFLNFNQEGSSLVEAKGRYSGSRSSYRGSKSRSYKKTTIKRKIKVKKYTYKYKYSNGRKIKVKVYAGYGYSYGYSYGRSHGSAGAGAAGIFLCCVLPCCCCIIGVVLICFVFGKKGNSGSHHSETVEIIEETTTYD